MYTNLHETQDSVRQLQDRVENGGYQLFLENSWGAIREKHITFNDVNLRELHDQVAELEDDRDWRHDKEGQFCEGLPKKIRNNMEWFNNPRTGLLEAGGPVLTSAFTDIIGQISYSRLLDVIDSPEFVAKQLFETVPAQTIGPEQLPGIAVLGESALPVGEGEPYPKVGMTPYTVTTPQKEKRGFIVELSEELEWEEKTGLLQRRFDTAANSMLQNLEKELFDVALGYETTYVRNNGPAQLTYDLTHTQGNFVNLNEANELVDFQSLDNAMNLFDDINDPDTGEPIMIGGTLQVVVQGATSTRLSNLLAASQVRFPAGQSAPNMTIAPNPIPNLRGRNFQPITSPYIKRRTTGGGTTADAETTWWIGDFRKAFKYIEVWPIQVFRSDTNSEAAFERDIRSRIKVRRFGKAVVEEPRYVQQNDKV